VTTGLPLYDSMDPATALASPRFLRLVTFHVCRYAMNWHHLRAEQCVTKALAATDKAKAHRAACLHWAGLAEEAAHLPP
jgi:hypothetical protein